MHVSSVVYNEIEPFAAAWLQNLSAGGHIAAGSVDTRSIEDIRAEEVAASTQFHTFAGIGVWSYALRLAGWPDDRPVWTGSCPCQPFSAAGKRGGFEDERHLWPAWFRLIRECRPPVIFGEQVASKDGLAWLDAVYADLEGEGYAVGAVDLCAAGVGAPHIRQRLFFVAERITDAMRQRPEAGLPAQARGHARHAEESRDGMGGQLGLGAGRSEAIGLADAPYGGRASEFNTGSCASQDRRRQGNGEPRGGTIGLADAALHRNGRNAGTLGGEKRLSESEKPQSWRAGKEVINSNAAIGLADDDEAGRSKQRSEGLPANRDTSRRNDANGRGAHDGPGPTNGYWRDADWLYCRDAKWRPVEPGSFPLAHGAPQRVGRLRGYGNAIVAQAAAEVIRAYMDGTSES